MPKTPNYNPNPCLKEVHGLSPKESCLVNVHCYESFLNFLCTFETDHLWLWSIIFITASIANLIMCFGLIYMAKRKYY